MKKLTHILTLGALSAALATAAVRADTITETGFLATPDNTSVNGTQTAIDLNNFEAWGYYSGLPAAVPTPTTDAANLAHFSNVTSGVPLSQIAGGFIWVSYTGGVGGSAPASEASTNQHVLFPDSGFSLTTTLFAPQEELSFYLLSFDATADISATVNGATFTLTNTPLPLYTDAGSSTDGSGHRQGTLVLDVTGKVGDVLTFTDTTDETGVSAPTNGNVSLIAVGADAVPEPAAYAMLLGGLGLLFLALRRKRVDGF
jgi:hypothetical protein